MPTLVKIGPCPPSRVDSRRRLDETLPGVFFCRLSGALPCLTQLGTQNGTGETSNALVSLAGTSSISSTSMGEPGIWIVWCIECDIVPNASVNIAFPPSPPHPPVPSQLTRSFPSPDEHFGGLSVDFLPTYLPGEIQLQKKKKERARLLFHLFHNFDAHFH